MYISSFFSPLLSTHKALAPAYNAAYGFSRIEDNQVNRKIRTYKAYMSREPWDGVKQLAMYIIRSLVSFVTYTFNSDRDETLPTFNLLPSPPEQACVKSTRKHKHGDNIVCVFCTCIGNIGELWQVPARCWVGYLRHTILEIKPREEQGELSCFRHHQFFGQLLQEESCSYLLPPSMHFSSPFVFPIFYKIFMTFANTN